MEKVIGAILIGIFLGWFNLCSYRLRAVLNKFSLLCLVIMLLCLGAKIGCNPQLLDKLSLLGRQSLFLGFSIILGSLAALWLTIKFLDKNFEEEEL